MKCNSCFVAVLAVSTAQACQHDFHHQKQFLGLESRLERRQAPAFPPALDMNEAVLSNSFDNTSIESWSYFYTHGLHWAGTNKTMADWTVDRYSENGWQASLAEYCRCQNTSLLAGAWWLIHSDTFMNYPVSKSVTMTRSDGSVYTPSLTEDELAEDEVTTYPNKAPTFHGYSFTGDASGELVYVGRGQKVDFDRLVALGVELEGKVALARYGGVSAPSRPDAEHTGPKSQNTSLCDLTSNSHSVASRSRTRKSMEWLDVSSIPISKTTETSPLSTGTRLTPKASLEIPHRCSEAAYSFSPPIQVILPLQVIHPNATPPALVLKRPRRRFPRSPYPGKMLCQCSQLSMVGDLQGRRSTGRIGSVLRTLDITRVQHQALAFPCRTS